MYDRQRLQEMQASASGTSTMDLISYVDFQSKYNSALASHRLALKAHKNFWRLLLTSNVSYDDMSSSFGKIETMERKASEGYALLLERYSKSVKVMRSYGKFLEDIKQDSDGAQRLYREADKLEDMDAVARRNGFLDTVFADVDAFDGGHSDKNNSVLLNGRIVLRSFNQLQEDRDPMVVLSKEGRIDFVNDLFAKIFGYKKNELVNRSLNLLIPTPLAGPLHDKLLTRAVNNQSKSIGRVSRMKAQS